MNIDDPKLTAYALDELDEAERAAIAHEVARSPQAQREVQETQTMARLLRAEFAAELEHRQDADATTKPLSANLSDIRDDPWFWSIAPPLAIAAVIAICAVIAGLAVFPFPRAVVNMAGSKRVNLPPARGELLPDANAPMRRDIDITEGKPVIVTGHE